MEFILDMTMNEAGSTYEVGELLLVDSRPRLCSEIYAHVRFTNSSIRSCRVFTHGA